MPAIVARFQAHKQFYVVGIGWILTGEIIEGDITGRQQLRFNADDKEIIYTVIDVETIEYMTAGTNETALILELVQGDKEINYLERITGKVAEVFEN